MTRPSWLWSFIAVAVALLTSLARPAHGADAVAGAGDDAAEELFWAFHACEEGMQADATVSAVRRLQLLDDYRFRKSRAVRADATVVKGGKVREYSVREWLQRCDGAFPKLADKGRKQAAKEEADLALATCRTATDRGTLEQAEADYKTFREKKQTALRLDPKSRAKRELLACDKRVSDWIAKRRQVEDNALKRVREDAQKTIADARREQNDSLAGRPAAGARLAVAIPGR